MLNQRTIGLDGEGVIARQVRHVYECLSFTQHRVSEISRCIQVSTKGRQTTMQTTKTASKTSAESAALVAQLARKSRVDALDNNSCSLSLILDEILQLEETPVAYPIIHPSPAPLFSYAFEVFQHNTVSIEAGNDLFAYVVVSPSHPTVFSTTNLPKKTLSGTSAFGLQFGTQKLELSLALLNFAGIVKPAVTRDGEVVYSEVNAENLFVNTRANGIDLFGKSEQEKHSAFIISSQKTFAHLPVRTKVLRVTRRNSERDFNPAFNCCQTQNVTFEACASRKIIPHTTTINNWLAFSLLDNSTRLLDASNGELRLQADTAQVFVNERVQFNVVLDTLFPSSINAMLQAFSVNFESLNYLVSCNNLDFGSRSGVHNEQSELIVFKPNGGSVNSSPHQERGVSLTQTL